MPKLHKYPVKLFDIDRMPRSRVEKYWHKVMFKDVFNDDKRKLPSSFQYYDQDHVLEKFQLRGLQYGNWLNQEDRYQYLMGAAISLYDLAKITGFTHKQVGFEGTLRLSFGARGSGSALAHFEPWSKTINITRYREEDKDFGDKDKYLEYGGSGSLGHEWAHALDCFIQMQLAAKNTLSSGYLSEIIEGHVRHVQSEGWAYTAPRTKLERLMCELMLSIKYQPKAASSYWEKSNHVNRIKDGQAKGVIKKGPYWTSTVELFARSFEMFLATEMKKLPYKNEFLSEQKYGSSVYQTPEEAAHTAPRWKALLSYCKTHIVEGNRGFRNQLLIE